MSRVNLQANASDWLEEKDESPLPGGSLGSWQKPYDILIKEAINKTKMDKEGSNRQQIFDYVRCRYPNMKYQQTKKGISRAIRRMAASGHIKQPKPGYFNVTPKGQSLKWQYGTKFDR